MDEYYTDLAVHFCEDIFGPNWALAAAVIAKVEKESAKTGELVVPDVDAAIINEFYDDVAISQKLRRELDKHASMVTMMVNMKNPATANSNTGANAEGIMDGLRQLGSLFGQQGGKPGADAKDNVGGGFEKMVEQSTRVNLVGKLIAYGEDHSPSSEYDKVVAFIQD